MARENQRQKTLEKNIQPNDGSIWVYFLRLFLYSEKWFMTYKAIANSDVAGFILI